MKKRTVVNAINMTPQVAASYPAPSTASEFMKTLFIVDRSTRISNRVYGASNSKYVVDFLPLEDYAVTKAKLRDFYEVQIGLDTVDGFDFDGEYYFMLIPEEGQPIDAI